MFKTIPRRRYRGGLALTAAALMFASTATFIPAGAQSVSGTVADSGWAAYIPASPDGEAWTFVEPINDTYHPNYFNIANTTRQGPLLAEVSESSRNRVTSAPDLTDVDLTVSITSETIPTTTPYTEAVDGVDYLADTGPSDGVVGNNYRVSVEFNAESGDERTLVVAAPGAGGRGFCAGSPEVGITAQPAGADGCAFTIPSGVTWAGSRNLDVRVEYFDRRSTPVYTNAGNGLTRPVTSTRLGMWDSFFSSPGEINARTGEGSIGISSHTYGRGEFLGGGVIHAEDFPEGTQFWVTAGEAPRPFATPSTLTRTASQPNIPFGRVDRESTDKDNLYRIWYKLPASSLPQGEEALSRLYDIGYSLNDTPVRNTVDWDTSFYAPTSKVFLNEGGGHDAGSHVGRDVRVAHQSPESNSLGGFDNNNWARVSWVEPIPGGVVDKIITMPGTPNLGDDPYGTPGTGNNPNLVREYGFVTHPQAQEFAPGTSGTTSVRLASDDSAGWGSVAGLMPDHALQSGYDAYRTIAYGSEAMSTVIFTAATDGTGRYNVSAGDVMAVCDVWDTRDFRYDDSRDIIAPDGSTFYYSTSANVTGPLSSRTGACGDYADTSQWSTTKPANTDAITGVVATLEVTPAMINDSEIVTLFAASPVKVPAKYTGGPVPGDSLPDWFSGTTSTTFPATNVRDVRIVTPPPAPRIEVIKKGYISESGAVNSSREGARQLFPVSRGNEKFYAIHPYIQGHMMNGLHGDIVVEDTLPRCLEAATLSNDTLAAFEVVSWENRGEAICGNDDSPQEKITLKLRPEAAVFTTSEPGSGNAAMTSIGTPNIVVSGRVSRIAPTNSQLVNKAVATYSPAASNIQISEPIRANDTNRTRIIAQADTGLVKTVDKDVIEPGDPVTWTLSALNETTTVAGDTTFIDVLPKDGMQWPQRIEGQDYVNDFTGGLNITEISVVPGLAPGTTVSYTSHPQEQLDSTQVNQPGVNWVSDVNAIGGYDNVTGLRIFVPNFGEEGSKVAQVKVTAELRDTMVGDRIVNKLGRGITENINLDIPDPEPVKTDVVSSTISGTVWHDKDRNAELDGSEPGLDEVTVTLCRVDDGKGLRGPWTMVTDADGQYEFTGLHSGQYVVSLNGCAATESSTVPAGFPLSDQDGFEQTYSYEGNRYEDAMVIATTGLGMDAAIENVNFGFYAEDPFFGISFPLPDTGDGLALWVLFAVTGAGLVVVTVFMVRNSRSRKLSEEDDS